MYFRLDQLGKNVLREFFMLVGAAETEVEVPAGDAQRIDIWHVPDPQLLQSHPEIEPGLLRSMASEQGMVEVFSDAPAPAELHGCMRKRYQWHHTLELRADNELPLPSMWLVCAGRPDGVLRAFGFVQGAGSLEGLYATWAPAWQVQIVVLAELPRVRSTVLLRLLGSARVRRMALRDLAALPEDAWERRLALPWLVRLSFEVPAELLPGLPVEERDFIMETREWYEQWSKQHHAQERKEIEHAKELLEQERRLLEQARQEHREEKERKQLEQELNARREQERRQLEHEREQLEQERKLLEQAQQERREQDLQATERGQLKMTARLCGIRLGRPLTEAEHTALAEHLDRLGEDRVGAVLLSSAPESLAAWLADPDAQ